MILLFCISLVCSMVAAAYLLTLGIDPRIQRDRLSRACVWLVVPWTIQLAIGTALMGGRP